MNWGILAILIGMVIAVVGGVWAAVRRFKKVKFKFDAMTTHPLVVKIGKFFALSGTIVISILVIILYLFDPFVFIDSDNDTIPRFHDNCPTLRNNGQGDHDKDGTGDICDDDDDDDGISDKDDPIPRSHEISWDSANRNQDHDQDKLRDADEDHDDDNDGIPDMGNPDYTGTDPRRKKDDPVRRSVVIGWNSADRNQDYDQDGLRDADEDDDDDNDELLDNMDDDDNNDGCIDTCANIKILLNRISSASGHEQIVCNDRFGKMFDSHRQNLQQNHTAIRNEIGFTDDDDKLLEILLSSTASERNRRCICNPQRHTGCETQ